MSKSMVYSTKMTSVAPSAKAASARATSEAKKSKQILCSQLATAIRKD
jgi:hypothetical protein